MWIMICPQVLGRDDGGSGHPVITGCPDGFTGGYLGPDIHQDYWGQFGGGDMPAMELHRQGMTVYQRG